MSQIDTRKKKSLRNMFYAVRSYFSVQANVLIVIFAVLLLVLTVYPMFSVIYSSLTVGKMEAMRFNSLYQTSLSAGDLTLLNFKTLLTNEAIFWKPLWNSFRMSAYASLIAILLGGTIAFLITRTDIRCKKFFSSVFIFPYIMPSWTLALVWKNVFANSRVGTGVVGMLESLTGLCVPGWIVYGIFPCALVMGIHYAPFAYILIGGTLRNMDANLEEAATILQAGRWRIIRKITLPIVRPALFSTILLVFSSTMASYAVPVFVGSPGNFFVLSTQLSSLYNTMATKGQAFVMTIVLIIFGIVLLGINLRVTGKRKSFTTVTGKSGQVSYIKLGKANRIISAVLVILLFLIAIFPIVSFALESMCEVQGDYSTLTFKYWLSREEIGGFAVNAGKGILFNDMIWSALWGSLKLSLIVSLIVGTSGILIGYAVARKRGTKIAGLVSGLAFFPYLVPSMAFGAIFLAVSTRLIFLRGTMLLLIIVGAIKYLPFASRSGTNSMMQLSGEIEEAAVLVGASWPKRMLRILFPIQKSSFISGYLLPFISCMRELSLFVLLASSGTLITTLLSYFDEKAVTQMSNGINLLIVIIVLLVNFTINKLTGASIDKGVGGN
uniref:ABC transporter transmembrane protein n=1 Tax=uncultured bacterium Contigcl_23 TaxID=1393667 RepID=W0FRF9_9BACT|nr:ABC transporter transmembrane protein [uncultured bacterium Contigcl_23]